MSSTRLTNGQLWARLSAGCAVFFAGWTWSGWQLHTHCVERANTVERKIARDIGWVEERDGKLYCLAEGAIPEGERQMNGRSKN